jgi:hypothetical protein
VQPTQKNALLREFIHFGCGIHLGIEITHIGLERPSVLRLFHTFPQLLIFGREPIIHKLLKTNPSQICYQLRFLIFFASLPPKDMILQKNYRYGNLILITRLLDITKIVHFQ